MQVRPRLLSVAAAVAAAVDFFDRKAGGLDRNPGYGGRGAAASAAVRTMAAADSAAGGQLPLPAGLNFFLKKNYLSADLYAHSCLSYVSAYSYICVVILLYMCPHTIAYVSAARARAP